MKTSRFKKLAWAFFALALTATSVSAQGFGYQNRVSPTTDVMPCLAQISDLTEKQKTEILAIRQKQQETMAVIREGRRSTVDFDKKNNIRQEMLESKVNHQYEMKALLNPQQQKQYDLILAGGGKLQYRNNPSRAAYGNRGVGFRQSTGTRANCMYAASIKSKGQGKVDNSGKNSRGFRFSHPGMLSELNN